MTKSQRAFLITVAHGCLLVAGLAYGGYRYTQLQANRILPQPVTQPAVIAPSHHDSALISDADLQLVLERLQPRLAQGRPSINHVDHALRFWGVAATFADPECLSGVELRELLLDHRAFRAAWDQETEPLLMVSETSPAGVQFRTRQGAASSSHVDHTLAGLAEVGTPSDYPVLTPQGERPLREALTECFRDFRLNQEEYEWSAMVWLLYYPHVHEWTSTEGQIITWDHMADRLMRQRLSQGVCFGQHRLYTLAALLQRDQSERYLSPDMRGHVISHLHDATGRLVASQHAEGYWKSGWPGTEWDGEPYSFTGPMGTQADRILATGHVLEWWLYAPAEVQPPREIIARASTWLVSAILELTPQETRRFYPFLTHAGRALSLWHGVEPHAVVLPEPQREPR
ncbi:hypothetical protein GC163_09955 [bacterium]|nr:hypothetical protein [bacterium]